MEEKYYLLTEEEDDNKEFENSLTSNQLASSEELHKRTILLEKKFVKASGLVMQNIKIYSSKVLYKFQTNKSFYNLRRINRLINKNYKTIDYLEEKIKNNDYKSICRRILLCTDLRSVVRTFEFIFVGKKALNIGKKIYGVRRFTRKVLRKKATKVDKIVDSVKDKAGIPKKKRKKKGFVKRQKADAKFALGATAGLFGADAIYKIALTKYADESPVIRKQCNDYLNVLKNINKELAKEARHTRRV